jgi:hypothetical protein
MNMEGQNNFLVASATTTDEFTGISVRCDGFIDNGVKKCTMYLSKGDVLIDYATFQQPSNILLTLFSPSYMEAIEQLRASALGYRDNGEIQFRGFTE